MNGSFHLKGVEAEFNDITNRNAWHSVFETIVRQSLDNQYTCNEAKKLANKQLNRYRDVRPYDHSRVILKRRKVYINANLVKMERAGRRYILTQGPLASTVSHFWLMVWEQKSRAIIMLNKLIEKNETKCHRYWPLYCGTKSVLLLKDVDLSVEKIFEEELNNYTFRLLRVVDLKTNESRDVIQFHYTNWPDFGVPQSPKAFLNYLYHVRTLEALDSSAGPAVVHCSAGIGRSGTFCLVDSCLVLLKKEDTEDLSVSDVLLELRKYRMGLIQTAEQLRFSYEAIIAGAGELDIPDPPLESRCWEKGGTEFIHLTPMLTSPPTEESSCSDEEEAPPPPPPRGESLSGAPKRPLPSIPGSSSLGDLYVPEPVSDDSRSATPASESLPGTPVSESLPATPVSESLPSSGDDNKEPSPTESGAARSELRRRRNQELAARVAATKRRVRDAERWQDLKRSMYKPLTIIIGAILTGVAIYAYAKR